MAVSVTMPQLGESVTEGTVTRWLKAEGDDGEANYVVDASHFQTHGYRDHSNAERDIFNAKLRLALGDEGAD